MQVGGLSVGLWKAPSSPLLGGLLLLWVLLHIQQYFWRIAEDSPYTWGSLEFALLRNVVEHPCIQPQETGTVIERRKKDDFKEEVTAVPVWAGYEHLWLPSAPLSDLAPPDVHVHREVLSESLVEVGDGISTEIFWPPGFPSISRALLPLPIFLLLTSISLWEGVKS